MKTTLQNIASISLILGVASLAGCGGGGSAASNTTQTSNNAPIEGVATPTSVSVVTAKNAN
ncbi:hypothetical protein ACMYR3_12580 [Ampullimonas aquatilis]|uniref:hypothetical protein n=1 Tax=Ampullimonas aquatilis TaxID=1341549 RepID=UPI003C766E5C